ncbi:hypothetical protein BABINDRAFT_159894 [Babjeviella inositovora NRRL Y-12698]|uniref:PQ-loop repeat-containing protein n=1 Tax=Babjeviella inositovora NRRL Y-12698 TaxID=984486 RepID=A0A1E3QX97_9ASCO|nr:uncharacterized protein BABINDRAFT_159894 [Babjeviella inositovora NRRL Y-12698]ODQ81627.1 hypothetical protein BABINDRAFT_159894 [Babjeviella inositovora NRRL Y-12698]
MKELALLSHRHDLSLLTSLSFASGYLSIVFWLFAQLPQVIENHRRNSVEGISISFLGCWVLGDLTNLIGCVLTDALPFQIMLALYYCCIDVILISQFYYYTKVHKPSHHPHGQRGKMRGHQRLQDLSPPFMGEETSETLPPAMAERLPLKNGIPFVKYDAERTEPKRIQIPTKNIQLRRNLVPGTASSSVSNLATASFIGSFAKVHAMPLSLAEDKPLSLYQKISSLLMLVMISSFLTKERIGMVSAWSCTALYLCSRAPQLYANHKRRTTSGLSIYLFIAALLGNITYTVSLLTSPNAQGKYGNDFLYLELPYLLGSCGTVGFDLFLLGQWYIFDVRGKMPYVQQSQWHDFLTVRALFNELIFDQKVSTLVNVKTGHTLSVGSPSPLPATQPIIPNTQRHREYSSSNNNIIPILIKQSHVTQAKIASNTPITCMDLLDMTSSYGDRPVGSVSSPSTQFNSVQPSFRTFGIREGVPPSLTPNKVTRFGYGSTTDDIHMFDN